MAELKKTVELRAGKIYSRTCHAPRPHANVRPSVIVNHFTRAFSSRSLKDSVYELSRLRRARQEEARSLCARNHGDEGIHSAGNPARTVHDGCAGRGQCLSRPSRRHHHCRDIPRRSHRHGCHARLERIAARRKHRPHRGIHWRIRRRRRNLHSTRVPAVQGLAVLSHRRCLLEIHRTDHGRQHSRRPLHLPGSPRHGGRPRVALPRIAGRL